MKNLAIAIALSALSMTATAAPVLNTTNFIAAPSHFNGFEAIPNDGTFFTGGNGPYIEGGVTVTQASGSSGNNIWVTLGGLDGNHSWYPNGGDNGYTQIVLASGSDFSEISLLFRAWDTGNVQYDLLEDGTSIFSGSILSANGEVGRIGFSSGGFDEVRLRTGTTGTFGDNRFQALQIDSIKANEASGGGVVPEPGILTLTGLSMLALFALRRRRA